MAVRVGAVVGVSVGVLVGVSVEIVIEVALETAVKVGVGSGAAKAFPPSRKPKIPPRNNSPTAAIAMSQRDMTRIYASEDNSATRLLGLVAILQVFFFELIDQKMKLRFGDLADGHVVAFDANVNH